ncbi:MAG: hypothetical protein V3U65_18960 [Granulosicoccaceae bacterium]
MKAVFILLLSTLLASCASGEYYEARPITPTNLSPAVSSDITVGAETEFVWTAVSRADRYQFHLFNRNNGDITQYYMENLSASQVCAADRCSVVVKVELPANINHAWRVRAMNNQGASVWSRSMFNLVEP